MIQPPPHTFIEIDCCDSTNDFIKQEKWRISEACPLVVTCKEQLKGRGRNNRKWFSPRGAGLYISIGLSMKCKEEFQLLGLIGGLAIAETLNTTGGPGFRLKWPNDILYQKKKIAGVLIENSFHADRMISITGMGINLNHTPEDFPEEIRNRATSLKIITGKPVERKQITPELITYFFYWIAALKRGDRIPIVKAANRLSVLSPGDTLCIRINDQIFSGIYREINSDGGLVIEKKNGRVDIVYSGEIVP